MEKAFHQWLKSQDSVPTSSVGIGDDAALIDFRHLPGFENVKSSLVLATDGIAEGTHFLIGEENRRNDLVLAGRKLIAINLSDIAAVAATPRLVTLHFQLPDTFTLEDAKAIYAGARMIADQYDVTIVGGDTNRWSGPANLSATLIGVRPETTTGWRVDQAKVGDKVLVTGRLGGSLLGHHLTFVPRVRFALSVASQFQVHAATDISDSLSLDLMAIANASQVAIEIACDQIPCSESISHLPPADQIQRAMFDGEDFELIMTLEPEAADELLSSQTADCPVTCIGKVISGKPALLDDRGIRLPVKGYEH